MEVSEAEARLREMLRDGGFDFANPLPQKAWEVLKRFVREPVNCSEDGVLFECGVYSFTGEPLFNFGFVRQFGIEVDGEYEHMEQLHCLFTCPPTTEAIDLKTNLWLEKYGKDYDAFFAAVEALPQFRKGLEFSGWQCEVFHEEV